MAPNPWKSVPPEAQARARRLFMAAECRTQAELAALLGITQGAVAYTLKRGSIPDSWLLALVRLKGANPDWILFDYGPERLES